MSDTKIVFKLNLNTIEQTYDDLTVDEATIERMVNDGYSLTEENVITDSTSGRDFIRNSNYFKTINVLYRASSTSELEIYSFNPLEGRADNKKNNYTRQCKVLLEPLIYALNNFVSIKQDNLKYLNIKLGADHQPILFNPYSPISEFSSYRSSDNADDYINDLIFKYPIYYKNINKALAKEDTIYIQEIKNMLFKFTYPATQADNYISTSEYLHPTKATCMFTDSYSYATPKFICFSTYSISEGDHPGYSESRDIRYWSLYTGIGGKDNYITCTFRINEPEYGWGVLCEPRESREPSKIYYDTLDVLRILIHESNLYDIDILNIYPSIYLGKLVLEVFPFNNKTYLLLGYGGSRGAPFNLDMRYILSNNFPDNPFKELNAESPIDTSDYYSGYIVINEKYEDFISKKHNFTINTAFLYNSGYSNLYHNVYITIDGKLQVINYTKVDADENGVRSFNSYFGKKPLFSSYIFYGNIYYSLWDRYPIIANYNDSYIPTGFVDYSLDIYDIEVGIGTYEYLPDLTAYITASRNPVSLNIPSQSTSVLTCHVDGVIDRNQDKYNRYKEILDSYIDCTGDYVKYVNVDGTEVIGDKSTINNEYFNLNANGSSWRIGEHTYHATVGKSYLWEETSQIVSIGNLYTSLMYTGASTGYDNEMHIYPTLDNKYIIKTPNYTSEELDGLYDKHTYKLYAIYGDIRPSYLTLILYRDDKEVKFYDSDGNPIEYRQIEMTANTVAGAHTNRFWIDIFYTYDKYNQNNNSTNFYSRKVYTLLTNSDYEEYPELTYLWNTGETTKQITVQPIEPTTYTCTVTQGSRTVSASILIIASLTQSKPIAVISPQEKPYIEHMIGRFYATNSYDINDPVSPIVKYIWNDVETISPVFVTRVKRTDKIRLKVVNALGLVSDEVEVDLSKDTDQWGNKYKFLDIPMFLICSKGANLFDTLISRFPIPSRTLDLYSNFYPTEYDKYTSIGFTTDISTDTIRYMACLPHHGVAEYTANREQVDIYPLGISWLEKRNMIKYYNKVKGSKGSLLACIGHPELQEEGYGSLEFVLDALGIITPKERYTIPRLLDLLELLLMDYENGGLIKL